MLHTYKTCSFTKLLKSHKNVKVIRYYVKIIEVKNDGGLGRKKRVNMELSFKSLRLTSSSVMTKKWILKVLIKFSFFRKSLTKTYYKWSFYSLIFSITYIHINSMCIWSLNECLLLFPDQLFNPASRRFDTHVRGKCNNRLFNIIIDWILSYSLPIFT